MSATPPPQIAHEQILRLHRVPAPMSPDLLEPYVIEEGGSSDSRGSANEEAGGERGGRDAKL